MNNMEQIQSKILDKIAAANDLNALESVRVETLGKQGEISLLMRSLGKMDENERKTMGQVYNQLRDVVAQAIEEKKESLEVAVMEARLAEERVDVTLPVRPGKLGYIHPFTQTLYDVISIFKRMGFAVAEGPEIETDFYNFTALNIPPEHPARQEADTFYFAKTEKDEPELLLRTQTSTVQIRTMQEAQPPIRIIAPGRVYRSDWDQTHTPNFHQVEGLWIDSEVNMGHLKGCLLEFCREFFGVTDLPVRYRPSFFPFTEPSAEMDIGCSRAEGELKIGAGDDWLEILGCGMVHPNVLRQGGIDPEKYQGFAFGMGLERIAMLKYGIPDLRSFYEADPRWSQHYGFAGPNALFGDLVG
jgi:phenylalanyl-tRNA synthetase alpha chain